MVEMSKATQMVLAWSPVMPVPIKARVIQFSEVALLLKVVQMAKVAQVVLAWVSAIPIEPNAAEMAIVSEAGAEMPVMLGLQADET
jgi:hypothetical protein